MTYFRKTTLVLALCILKLSLSYNFAEASAAEVAARTRLTALEIAPITQHAIDAMQDLQAGHAGLAPIAAPTLYQLTAAMKLRGDLNIHNFTTAQLDAVADFLNYRVA